VLTVDQALELTDPNKVIEQIRARQKLRRQMVGGLYPGILADEEIKLQDHITELNRKGLKEAANGS
jgi:hypothetical protein